MAVRQSVSSVRGEYLCIMRLEIFLVFELDSDRSSVTFAVKAAWKLDLLISYLT